MKDVFRDLVLVAGVLAIGKAVYDRAKSDGRDEQSQMDLQLFGEALAADAAFMDMGDEPWDDVDEGDIAWVALPKDGWWSN